jgi:para-nitrobenzyl esterase
MTKALLAALLLACSSNNDAPPPAATDSGTNEETIIDTGPLDPGAVITDKGPVKGTAEGAFFNIPYATAQRFSPPVPAAPWTDLRDATKRGPACSQGLDPLTMMKPVQSEDCLALNVWTPSTNGKAPVMVFIHGGSFTNGSGNMALYDGENLKKRGVVVVTINYRLGAFGFLAHPELSKASGKDASGNQGFLDQVAALSWVKTNIAKFGGDPSNVTIFGESAGAISVCLHVVSPLSKGLFHKAISESGSCALVTTRLRNTTAAEDSAEERGTRLAKELGCDAGDVLACLRSKPVDDIIAKSASAPTEISFGPNVDGYAIPTPPMKMLVSGPANDVPYLMGANGDEATLFTQALTINNAAEYEALIRSTYPAAADTILGAYPASAFPSAKDAYNAFWGDALFVCPARWSAQAMSARKPTYLYHFTHVTSLGTLAKLGSFHASELWFVFGNFASPLAAPTADEKALSDALGTYWTTFAKTGEPGANPVSWPKYTVTEDKHLVLASKIEVGSALTKSRCDVLAALAP